MYYNTTALIGDELAERIKRADGQERQLYVYMKAHPEKRFIRDEIHAVLFPKSPPTSAGRALNSLLERGLIIKLASQRRGQWDALQYEWQFKG